MAVYKVPQDVEAEDKLIGPFSFRQFIYLIVAGLGIFLAWALGRVFIGLGIIPLPIVIAMLALALPLRKDQPMETYLIAMIKFFFKPRKRLWDPEGEMALVRIIAAKVDDGPQLKDVAGDEASQRLEYLSQIVDSQGWSSRGVAGDGSMNDIFLSDASKAEDMLDDSSSLAQSLNQRITQTDDNRLQTMKQQFQASAQLPQTDDSIPLPSVFPVSAPDSSLTVPLPPDPQTPPALAADPHFPFPNPQSPTDPTATPFSTPQSSANPAATPQSPTFNPYPTAMRQKVLSPTPTSPQPLTDPAAAPFPISQPPIPPAANPQPPAQPQAESTGPEAVSPDIIRLANNNDLSISALAREAERLKKDDDQEVVVSLR